VNLYGFGQPEDGAGQRLTDVLGIGVLTRLFHRDLVDEVVVETGRKEQRVRLLPARVMVYYVLALALFFGESYEEVMRRLVGGLSALASWRGEWKVPTSSAICQARKRLGEDPFRVLFDKVAVPCAGLGAKGAWFRDLRVMSIDGVVLDLPDTKENAAAFGYSGGGKNESPYPKARIVALAECGTHAITAAQIGPWANFERQLAEDLLEQLTDDMLVLADRGFYSYDLWGQAAATGAHLLWRVSDTLTLPVLKVLPDGTYLTYINKPYITTKKADLSTTGIWVRVIEYHVPTRGFGELYRLITTLADPVFAPAEDLAALYAQRWEHEGIYAEIETHQLTPGRTLRSQSPQLVRQEIWAILLTHYAIRAFMAEAAEEEDIDPDRLSFIRTLRIIRRSITDQAGFSPSTTVHDDPTG
jgi:IS4 transposase